MILYGSHFTTEEFACKCGCGFGSQESDISKELIRQLETIRHWINAPLRITSGARCAAYNTKVGGEPHSAHMASAEDPQCRAADLDCQDGVFRMKLIDLTIAAGIRRIGIAHTFVHVDVAVGPLYPNNYWVY